MMDSATHTAAIIPEMWSAKFYEVLLAKLPFVDSLDMSYQGEIASLGDTVNISTVPEFAAAAELAETANGTPDDITITGQQLVIDKRTYKDYIVTKKAQLESLEFMNKLRDKAIYAIQKRMQAVIIAAIVPSAAAPDHAIAYASATTLALSDFLGAKELLDAQNVPLENRVCVLGSAQWNDLFNITGFVSRDFVPAGSPLTSGDFNQSFLGFMPKLTTVVGNTSYFFHPSFMTMAIQQNLNIEVFNLGVDGTRASRVNADVLWGLKQLDNKRVVTIS